MTGNYPGNNHNNTFHMIRTHTHTHKTTMCVINSSQNENSLFFFSLLREQKKKSFLMISRIFILQFFLFSCFAIKRILFKLYTSHSLSLSIITLFFYSFFRAFLILLLLFFFKSPWIVCVFFIIKLIEIVCKT